MEKKLIRLLFLGFVIAFFIDLALADVFYKEVERQPTQVHIDIQGFQMLDISGNDLKSIQEFCADQDLNFCAYLSAMMLHYEFSIPQLDEPLKKSRIKEADVSIERLYHRVFDDLKCFPVVGNKAEDIERYNYSDSFLAERTYGGDRKHMGTDIMDAGNEGGYYSIVSMTEGTIENMGWLELGGYRIGIRSESGAYFYYAHLHDYALDLQEGDEVKAGQLLGHMGSTGYGPVGTNDQFDVHLHMGISLNLDGQEFWVNPYAILQMLDPAF